MLHTRLTRWLNIPHPIVQGGMAWLATSELVIAVSQAGGLGILGAGNAPTAWVAEQISTIQGTVDGPFGVNVPMFSPYTAEVIALCAERHVPVVSTGAGNPAPHISALKTAGCAVVPVVASASLARRLERAGADAVIAEGRESGGHVGTVSTLALVPQVVDAVDIPVIAAGGIGDGRGLAAVLALGACGAQMGTRFICTDECIAHANYKQSIVRASDRSTIVTGESVAHPVRCIRNPMVREFERMEKDGVSEDEIMAFGAGKLKLAAIDGDVRGGSVMAGQVSGLVHDVASVATVIERVVSEAASILGGMQQLLVD